MSASKDFASTSIQSVARVEALIASTWTSQTPTVVSTAAVVSALTFASGLVVGASVIGLTLEAIAKGQERSPWDVFFDLLIAHDGRVAALYALMHEDDVREVLRQPWVTPASDGSAINLEAPGVPHPRSYGSHVRVIARYVKAKPAAMFTSVPAIAVARSCCIVPITSPMRR